MAPKKKFPVRIYAVISLVIGIGVLGFFAIPVLGDILPTVDPSEGGLEIPFPLTDDPIVLPDDIIENDDENSTNNLPNVPDEVVDEIDDILNMTETSDDPPIVQICDQTNLFCGSAKPIQLETNVVKIDSMGNKFNSTIFVDIPLASLFIEDTSNIDFRTGIIEIGFNLVSEPNFQLGLVGSMDVLINDVSILTETIPLTTSGLVGQDGKVEVLFQGVSPTFTFAFNQNFDKFPNERISKLTYLITDLKITQRQPQLPEGIGTIQICPPNCGAFEFGLTNQEVFTMKIFRDDIQIFITDEQGNDVISYPKDDRFTVTSTAISQTSKNTCTDPTCPSCPTLSGNSLGGCSYSSFVIANHDAPNVQNIKLFDENGIIITAGAGTGLVIDETLFRNENYSLTSPYGNFNFETPKSQKNYVYKCYLWQEVDYKRVDGSITNTIRPRSWHYYSPFVVGGEFILCNFPK